MPSVSHRTGKTKPRGQYSRQIETTGMLTERCGFSLKLSNQVLKATGFFLSMRAAFPVGSTLCWQDISFCRCRHFSQVLISFQFRFFSAIRTSLPQSAVSLQNSPQILYNAMKRKNYESSNEGSPHINILHFGACFFLCVRPHFQFP